MFGIHDLHLFILASLLLYITPGVDFLYVLSRGASRGLGAGVWAALGIGAGCIVHTVAAAVGLSAVLASSASAFTVVKWAGAAYLVYVGVSMLRQREGLKVALPADPQPQTMTQVFWQGFATNVLNPKVALFFLAFMPQFIDANSPTKVQAFLVLGALFDTGGTLWNLTVAWAAAFMARQLQAAGRIRIWLNRCLGTMFIGLGIKLALTRRA